MKAWDQFCPHSLHPLYPLNMRLGEELSLEQKYYSSMLEIFDMNMIFLKSL
jgi:hypothetical protein